MFCSNSALGCTEAALSNDNYYFRKSDSVDFATPQNALQTSTSSFVSPKVPVAMVEHTEAFKNISTKVFQYIDTDNDGQIDVNELVRFSPKLAKILTIVLAIVHDVQLTPYDVVLFSQYSVDRGHVSFTLQASRSPIVWYVRTTYQGVGIEDTCRG